MTDQELEHFYRWSIMDIDGNITGSDIDFEFMAKDCLEYLQEIWEQSCGTIKVDENLVSIHTGGWSDNELVIRYLRLTMWWSKYYECQSIGGHYYFNLDKSNDKAPYWHIAATNQGYEDLKGTEGWNEQQLYQRRWSARQAKHWSIRWLYWLKDLFL